MVHIMFSTVSIFCVYLLKPTGFFNLMNNLMLQLPGHNNYSFVFTKPSAKSAPVFRRSLNWITQSIMQMGPFINDNNNKKLCILNVDVKVVIFLINNSDIV